MAGRHSFELSQVLPPALAPGRQNLQSTKTSGFSSVLTHLSSEPDEHKGLRPLINPGFFRWFWSFPPSAARAVFEWGRTFPRCGASFAACGAGGPARGPPGPRLPGARRQGQRRCRPRRAVPGTERGAAPAGYSKSPSSSSKSSMRRLAPDSMRQLRLR